LPGLPESKFEQPLCRKLPNQIADWRIFCRFCRCILQTGDARGSIVLQTDADAGHSNNPAAVTAGRHELARTGAANAKRQSE
jgi:hypothetical protein